MRRFATFGAALPLLALGAACSDNNTVAPPEVFRQVVALSDFEGGISLNKDPRWDGLWDKSADTGTGAAETFMQQTFVRTALAPARMNPDGTASTWAMQIEDFGAHTLWGSAVFTILKNSQPVDLSGYTGISMWARSDNFPPPTVKVALPDLGSYPAAVEPGTGLHYCDEMDNTVGGRGCYDDYSVKIYPDGVWRRYDIPFSSLTTGGWGLAHAFDPSRIYSIKLSMLPSTTYSIWIDDVTLYLK